MVTVFIIKVKKWWGKNGSIVLLGAVIFLLVAFAFGGGWFMGSKTFRRPPIVVNCPANLYQEPSN